VACVRLLPRRLRSAWASNQSRISRADLVPGERRAGPSKQPRRSRSDHHSRHFSKPLEQLACRLRLAPAICEHE
jgi:hypothetical protein